MHLLNYDLHDLYGLFIFLRAMPHRFPHYREGIRQIADLIDSPEHEGAGVNCIRRILRPFHTPDDGILNWVLTDNVYTAAVTPIRSKAFYPLLSAMLHEVLDHGDDPDRLYLLADSLHNVPLILHNDVYPRERICTEIEPYQEKYNPRFLLRELKPLR